MRKCIRCDEEMVEDCSIQISGGIYELFVANKERRFAPSSIGKPKVAICPKCGEYLFI